VNEQYKHLGITAAIAYGGMAAALLVSLRADVLGLLQGGRG